MFRLLRLTRTLIPLVVVVALAGMAACVVSAGRMLVDPHAMETPRQADAIFVLAGGIADRWLEAHDLWREKRAPLMVLSRGYMDPGGLALRERGVRMPDGADIAKDVLVQQLGVPPDAVEILDARLDNTAAEAEALRQIAVARGWKHVIVVTSLPHTRRTALAMRRTLDPSGVAVQVRGSRYDTFQPTRWWQDRGSARWILSELPKLVAYRLGLGE